jgi:DNA-directed RNA polymerase subunit E'/Rpb7
MFFDNRSNERYDSSDHTVEYTVGNFSSSEIFEADLINVSERGLCMLSPHLLTVGQEITLRDFMNFSSRTAVVIWITENEEKSRFDISDQVLFRIGLEFSE